MEIQRGIAEWEEGPTGIMDYSDENVDSDDEEAEGLIILAFWYVLSGQSCR